MSDLKHVTDGDFKAEVLDSALPVLVDFWAPWCGPCRMVAPVIEAIAVKYAGRIKVVKMNTDENPAVPSQYNISGIPTIILFKKGQSALQLVGFRPQEQIESELTRVL